MAFRRGRAPGSLSSHARQRRRKAHCPARGGCACALRPSLVSCNLWRHGARGHSSAVRAACPRLVRVRRTYCGNPSPRASRPAPQVHTAHRSRHAYPSHSVASHVSTACEHGQCRGIGEAEGLGHQLGERVASSVVAELARLSQRLGRRCRLLHAGFEGPRLARLAARPVCAPRALLFRVSGRGVARRRGRHLDHGGVRTFTRRNQRT